MNQLVEFGRKPGLARTAGPLFVGIVAIAMALLIEGATATARGWLLCFAIVSGIPLGSLVLLMIHRLTGGAWGFALAPLLRGAAFCIPLVGLGFLRGADALGRGDRLDFFRQ